MHDIGKLAVPEHIISKPGRLTPEEFEKMKIHPVVGAEILERVRFPYPVVPIVRAHHEKWDGSGYPFGLKGEEIPIGARILSAVDCLDALASDRQYRRALPLEEVMKRLVAESGKSFDPKVVDVLQKRYRELEKLVNRRNSARSCVKAFHRSEDRTRRWRRLPALKTSRSRTRPVRKRLPFSIAAARQEAQTLFEFSQDLGASLSLDETLSVFSVKLRRLVPYDAIAIYVKRDEELIPELRQRRQFPPVCFAADSAGTGPVGLGGAEPEADHQRQSFGRTGIPERSDQVQHPAFSAGRSAGRAGWRRRRACALPCGDVMRSPRTTCAFCWRSARRWRWPSRTR